MKILGLKVIDAKPIIRKNLEENHLYKFVDFNENDLEYKEKYTDLFKLSDSSLNINISCIVGRNGTGKTSILEIIYRIINNISFDQFHKETDLSYAYGFYAQLFVEINTKIAVFEINNRNDFLYFNETPNTKYDIVNEKLTDEIISDFSYTIVNNYSYYSFNLDDYYDDEEKVDGSWLEQLFNKNDGYLTPLVINPKRDYWGTIDNENEAELVISRVNAMFLYFLKEKDVKLLNNYDIKGLSINFRDHRNDKDREEKINKYVHLIFGKKMFNPNFKSSMELYDSLYNFIKTNFKNIFIDNNIEKQTFVDNWKNDLNILDSAYNYLTYKILKISATYDRWNKHFYVDHKTNNNLVNSNELLNEIYLTQKERDHVTLKLWQCIEFIKNPTVYLTKKNFVELKDIVPKEKSLDGYYCILPPSFMNPQLVFNKDSDEEIKLNQISSGEKQSIYSFSYIIYHIKNVLSKSIEPKYKNFCLIFDEAELYMHPEFQRTFIFNLVKLLNNCNFDNIKSINILIATHSPYIIAEIPTKNILSLEKPNNKNKLPENISYCANYYDLMKNTFLLDFSISELAKHNIKKIIDFCNSDEMQIDEKTKNKFDLIIENIADPYLKNTLKTMFSTKINR